MPSHIDAIEKVLKHEGGYVDHPADKGGATNYGITQRVYEEFVKRKVTKDEIRNMPRGNAIAIYKRDYWDRVRGDSIKDYAVAFLIFDAAVNSGVSTAIKTAQRILGINPDGVAGAEFIKHLNAFNSREFTTRYNKAREDFYKAIVAKNPSQQVFIKGWLKRVSDNVSYVSKWIGTPVGKATAGIAGFLLLSAVGFFLFRMFKKK
jgi:lysozyme family protein